MIEASNTSILRTGALHCYHYYILSTGSRPLGSCPPRSGLERSDFVHWPDADFSQSLQLCPLLGQYGLVSLGPSFSEFDPNGHGCAKHVSQIRPFLSEMAGTSRP
jgi:hypothetical protein